MDAETAMLTETRLVFLADQQPFEINDHWFSILQPLMTTAGDPCELDTSTYPNRGRVWWMIRDNENPGFVTPGSLWNGTLMAANSFEPTKAESDKFQVHRESLRKGPGDWYEIIAVDVDDPYSEIIQPNQPIEWPREASPNVFLQGISTTVGPLRSSWDGESRRLTVQAVSQTNTEAIRVPTSEFKRLTQHRAFDCDLNRYDTRSATEQTKVILAKKGWIKLDKLREAGETVDLATDAQLISWAIQQCDLNRRESRQVRDVFNKLNLDSVGDDDQNLTRLIRLKEISEDTTRLFALGEDVAAEIAQLSGFDDLVEEHLDAIVEPRVTDKIAQQQDRIDAETKSRQDELNRISADLDRQSEEFEQRAKSQEEKLREQQNEWLSGLEKREKQAVEREAALEQQEEKLESRLERVIKRFEESAQQVGDDVIGILPLLHRMGIGGQGNGLPAGKDRPELRLPQYVSESPDWDRHEQLSETAFLDQFQKVATRRGFQFSDAALANFHLCMKAGSLTILAGPSGTGKSSLPFLYAEALGASDQFLHVAVRPDWLDDRDFIGAFNPLARRFDPGNSGVVEHLIAAELDASHKHGRFFLVCLDEMNLARVEHYFAQFLSVLERPPSERAISLFPRVNLPQPDDPFGAFQRVTIGDNVRFVGTVNIDETTHFFSPKVLDRAQVVCFRSPDLARITPADFTETIAGLVPVSLDRYREWTVPGEVSQSVRDEVIKLNEALTASRQGLGARQFQRILQYIGLAKGLLEEEPALDYQVLQVILPRIRRHVPGFAETLEGLSAILTEERFPQSHELLELMSAPGFENDFFQLI